MNWRTPAGTVAVAVVVLAIVGIIGNFGLGNDLLVASEMQMAALITLGFVVLSLAVFASLGRPWRAWNRTPYW